MLDPELWRVVSMTDDELATVDIAYLNLLCATGLPGAESLNIAECRKTLDAWAELVKLQTDRYLYKFQQNPEEYEGKEGYFRMLMLVTVLQQDLGVHYNMDRVREVDFKRSQDLFIHGLINSQNGGTCVSMPVLYTAVARRLGYPVRLTTAKEHIFCRWDDGKDRINVEGAGVGMNSYPDEHYHTWPLPISRDEIQRGEYLRSLTHREELALFLAARGHCLQDNGRQPDSYVAYAHAYELSPKMPENLYFLRRALRQQVNPQMVALQEAENARRRAELSYAENARLRILNDERRDREFQRVMELNRRAQQNPLTPFAPDFNSNTTFAPSNPDLSFPFPN